MLPNVDKLQENPEKISVFGRSMRTTSSLEAYNCRLNDIIVTHKHFFTIIRELRKEEFIKSKEFERFVISGGQQEEKRNKHVVGILTCSNSISISYIIFFSFLFSSLLDSFQTNQGSQPKIA